MKRAVMNTLLIAWMKFYPDFRLQPLVVAIQSGVCASPLFFFFIAGSVTSLKVGYIGAIVAIVSFIGINSAVEDVVDDRYTKVREMMVATPIRPISYAFGIGLASLFVSAPGVIMLMLVGVLLGFIGLVAIPWIFIALILCWICISMIGFILSSHLDTLPPRTLNGIGRFLSLGLVFLPPVYYADTLLGPFSWVSYLFPTSDAAGLIRAGLGLSTFSIEAVGFRLLILVGTIIFLVLLVQSKTKWRED